MISLFNSLNCRTDFWGITLSRYKETKRQMHVTAPRQYDPPDYKDGWLGLSNSCTISFLTYRIYNRRWNWNTPKSVGFEVLTAVIMYTDIFWDIMPCSQLKANRRFGGTHGLHLQGRKIS
jgi:hypothetical protein